MAVFFLSVENVIKQQRWKFFEKCLTFSFNTLFSALNTQRIRIRIGSDWTCFCVKIIRSFIANWILNIKWMLNGLNALIFLDFCVPPFIGDPRHRRKVKKEMKIKTLIAIKWRNRRINKTDRLLFIYIIFID